MISVLLLKMSRVIQRRLMQPAVYWVALSSIGSRCSQAGKCEHRRNCRYPLAIKRGNGQSPINGDFNGKIIYNGGFSIATFDCQRLSESGRIFTEDWEPSNTFGGFLEGGYPQFSSILVGFSIINYKPTIYGIPH